MFVYKHTQLKPVEIRYALISKINLCEKCPFWQRTMYKIRNNLMHIQKGKISCKAMQFMSYKYDSNLPSCTLCVKLHVRIFIKQISNRKPYQVSRVPIRFFFKPWTIFYYFIVGSVDDIDALLKKI